jgi:hypothetical protein
LGNGVTVANRFLGYPIHIAEVVFQTIAILIRLFPATSEAFGKPVSTRATPERRARAMAWLNPPPPTATERQSLQNEQSRIAKHLAPLRTREANRD